MEKTSIPLTKATRGKLRVYKAKRGMSYDEAIAELLEQVDDES